MTMEIAIDSTSRRILHVESIKMIHRYRMIFSIERFLLFIHSPPLLHGDGHEHVYFVHEYEHAGVLQSN